MAWKGLTLRQGRWVTVYPPMNTGRFDHAIVSTYDGDYIIVMGGFVRLTTPVPTATVELEQKMVHTTGPTRTSRSPYSHDIW